MYTGLSSRNIRPAAVGSSGSQGKRVEVFVRLARIVQGRRVRVVVDGHDVVDLVQQAGIRPELVIVLAGQRQRNQEHGEQLAARFSSGLLRGHYSTKRRDDRCANLLPNPNPAE